MAWAWLERWFGGGFIPHGHCYLWTPSMIWLQVVSNLIIGLAYLSISVTLYYVVRRIKTVPFRGLYLAFGGFIIACGLTHFSDIATIWHPLYWFDGGLRSATALVSMSTAVLLIMIVPKALALADSANELARLRGEKAGLEASLSDKEVLLKEIHHRVKNNLQVISSLLKLHGEKVVDPLAKATFEDSQERVRSIALLHELLYRSDDLGAVSAGDYVGSLVQTLLRTYGERPPARVAVEARGVVLPLDLAVPCGLILNELITNAMKHAFPAQAPRPPEIRVELAREGDGLSMRVCDNGVGLPPGFSLEASKSLGLQLVRTLARQLRAQVSVGQREGTDWSFKFRLVHSGEEP